MTTTKVQQQVERVPGPVADPVGEYVHQVRCALIDARVAVTEQYTEATEPMTYVIRTVLGSHVMDVVYAGDEGWSVITYLRGGSNPATARYSGPLTEQRDAAPRWIARMVAARRNVVMGEEGL